MTPTILIFGDSWACGEWPESPALAAVHKGIEEYFRQSNYKVVNAARGGCSNSASVSLLNAELNKDAGSSDIFIWVQSDPIRNLRDSNFADLPNRILKANGLSNLIEELLDEDYASLNQIAEQHNINVFIIGGLSSVRTNLLDKYPHIKCLVRSWPELLLSNKSEYATVNWKNYDILDSDWTVDHLKLNTFNNCWLSHKCVDELDQMNSNRIIYKDPIFYPNGNHPNREGHWILFNYIKKELNL